MAKFFKNDETVDTSNLREEIMSANCPSCIKGYLLDNIHVPINLNSSTTRDYLVEYLGLKSYFKTNVIKYSCGSPEFIWKLRDYISNSLCIMDTDIQNILLSQLFIWASTTSNQWHSFCSQCMPSK